MISTSETLGELSTALAKAQGELTDPEKNTKGYNYKYADLPIMLKTIRPVLTKHDLSFVQFTSGGDDNFVQVTTRLMHKSGEWMESTFSMPIEIKKGMSLAQNIGSTLTYARRYSIQSVVGISGDADTDHNDVRPDKNVTPTMPKRNGQINNLMSLNQLMEEIDKSEDIGVLNGIIELAKDKRSLIGKAFAQLADDEKNMVRDAYRIKRDELTTTTH